MEDKHLIFVTEAPTEHGPANLFATRCPDSGGVVLRVEVGVDTVNVYLDAAQVLSLAARLLDATLEPRAALEVLADAGSA